jgi:hypothetical protein
MRTSQLIEGINARFNAMQYLAKKNPMIYSHDPYFRILKASGPDHWYRVYDCTGQCIYMEVMRNNNSGGVIQWIKRLWKSWLI